MGTVVSADTVVTPTEVLRPGWLEFRDGVITAVGSGRPQDSTRHGAVLAPGFVDVHAHGGGGASFTDDPRTVLRAHLAHGTTTMVASLVTASVSDLERQVSRLADLVEAGELAGIHLEGPWLAASRCGAHDPALLRAPVEAEVAAVLVAARGSVRMVTIAPELPGALGAIDQVVATGARVAIGHTEASYDVTAEAIGRGATVATHLFNAMPPLLHRSPGPVAALLESASVVVELIADGHHLHPGALAHAARTASGGWMLVSDAMAAAGADDGDHRLGGLTVQVRGGVARLPDGTLAGSTLTLVQAVRTAVAAGIPLAAAIRAASSTPAAALGLEGRGGLVVGARADAVLLDAELGVQQVWLAGVPR